jgi:Fe-S oxidoreductase
VDVATYKAEFLSHYYDESARPLSYYAFTHIDRWSRLASIVPGLANFLTHAPGLRDIAKFAAGVAHQREVPRFASRSFRSLFKKRRNSTSAPPVMLWPDTFNNYFHPETAMAAADVLEAAGFAVRLPKGNVCCGRPLYDFGMLERAKRLLLRTLETLESEIANGIPIVVLEPSCASVFRDEMLNLFPADPRAQKLATQVMLLSEFLEKHGKNFKLPEINRKALVHGHCHHKSIMKMSAEESVLRRMGVDYQTPAPGCCGMAGAFGFEKEKYVTSIAIGELELLPAVRNAPADWLIIADGFSCREQIQQCTGRTSVHLAEVIQMALGKTS